MSWDDPHAWRASYDAWKLDAMDAYSYGDGPSMESVRELEDEMRGLVEENERLRAFVKTMLENDPNADAADGVSVLDVWRKEVLGAFPPPPAAIRSLAVQSLPHSSDGAAMTFSEMLADVRVHHATSRSLAGKLGISAQYLSDVERGRRLPSRQFVERICAYLGRGPKGRAEWHVAAARANGWEV